MLSLFKRLWNFFKFKKQTPTDSSQTSCYKRYSTTLDSAKEGVQLKEDLDPSIKEIVSKFRQSNAINHDELNKVISYYFNVPHIEPGVYSFNLNIITGMSVRITDVKTVYDDTLEIENIFVQLEDMVYGYDLVLTVNVKDFHEFFIRLPLEKLPSYLRKKQ